MKGNSLQPVAHIKYNARGEIENHDLHDHLAGTAKLAKEFASEFGAGDWAFLAGCWHDLGKYSEEFQQYIHSAIKAEKSEAHIETPLKGRVNHSSAGSLLAHDKFKIEGRVLAYLIAGHHAGLPDWHIGEVGASALSVRLADRKPINAIDFDRVPFDLLQREIPPFIPLGGRTGFHLWVRMLYSALVDADFLNTEAFMDASRGTLRGRFASLAALLEPFELFMTKLKNGSPRTYVNDIRDSVLSSCKNKASEKPGLFILEVPTGGGKTLSSMAFALNHAAIHNKRRIIYVIPFLSIIEQTADEFRKIFDENVIEHHSNLDTDEETSQSRLAAENWDAPIVVTTSVQFLESLFASRSSRCRKLHNIVNSVVILDEVQLLPPPFLQPILDILNLLMNHYGVTIVLSTATQPALTSKKWFEGRLRGLVDCDGSLGRKIVENPDDLFERLKRVAYILPDPTSAPREWPDMAAELIQHEKVLCIVNTRKGCRDLFRLMPKGTIHLSALMCGEHRSRTIRAIKERLQNQLPTRVVSTQLVEAGVDFDFPVVYRAMTGLDSIAQAAGRCNREGRLDRGSVVVFYPPQPSPPGLLRKAEDAARSVLSNFRGDFIQRDVFSKYFEQLYGNVDLDKKNIAEFTNCGDELEVQFKSAAGLFRIIDEAESMPLFVRYADGYSLIEQFKKAGPEPWILRKLQRYTVSLPKFAFYELLALGQIIEIYPGFYAQEFDAFYDNETGVKLPDEMIAPASLIF